MPALQQAWQKDQHAYISRHAGTGWDLTSTEMGIFDTILRRLSRHRLYLLKVVPSQVYFGQPAVANTPVLGARYIRKIPPTKHF